MKATKPRNGSPEDAGGDAGNYGGSNGGVVTREKRRRFWSSPRINGSAGKCEDLTYYPVSWMGNTEIENKSTRKIVNIDLVIN